MNYTVKLTEDQVDILLDILDAEISEEGARLEKQIPPNKIIRTINGMRYDFTELLTSYYELLLETQTVLHNSEVEKV